MFQSKLFTELGKENFDSSTLSFLGHINDHLFLLVREERHLELDLVGVNKSVCTCLELYPRSPKSVFPLVYSSKRILQEVDIVDDSRCYLHVLEYTVLAREQLQFGAKETLPEFRGIFMFLKKSWLIVSFFACRFWVVLGDSEVTFGCFIQPIIVYRNNILLFDSVRFMIFYGLKHEFPGCGTFAPCSFVGSKTLQG